MARVNNTGGNMKKILFSLFLLVASSGLIVAQDTPAAHGQGWLLSGVGTPVRQGAQPVFQLGFGGEGRLPYGLGAGAELGDLSQARNLGNGVGLFTAGAFYHFPTAQKVVPFVSAGYATAFRNGQAPGLYFSGGADYWFRDRLGVRFEVRDHVIVDYSRLHILGFRLGLSFR
jgi:hypothetical protein